MVTSLEPVHIRTISVEAYFAHEVCWEYSMQVVSCVDMMLKKVWDFSPVNSYHVCMCVYHTGISYAVATI